MDIGNSSPCEIPFWVIIAIGFAMIFPETTLIILSAPWEFPYETIHNTYCTSGSRL